MNIFITGTDTDVGKTIVTAGIMLSAGKKGLKTGMLKPVQTGAEKNPSAYDKFICPDEEFVKSLLPNANTKVSYSFELPVAPSLAAKLNSTEICTEKILHDYKALCEKCDFVVVEGTGGFLVPVYENFLICDLVKFLDLSLIIVARPDLGTINHTLLTIEAAKSRNIDIAGVIISNYPTKTSSPSIMHAPLMIEELSGVKLLGILPHLENIQKDAENFYREFSKHIDLTFIN